MFQHGHPQLPTRLTPRLRVLLLAAALSLSGAASVVAQQGAAGDTREAITLAPADRDFVTAQMRGFLEALQGVMDAAGSGKLAEAEKIAKNAGTAGTGNTPLSVRQSLPMSFRMLGRDTHLKFDAIGAAAANGDTAAVYAGVSGILANCNTCHRTYRLVTP